MLNVSHWGKKQVPERTTETEIRRPTCLLRGLVQQMLSKRFVLRGTFTGRFTSREAQWHTGRKWNPDSWKMSAGLNVHRLQQEDVMWWEKHATKTVPVSFQTRAMRASCFLKLLLIKLSSIDVSGFSSLCMHEAHEGVSSCTDAELRFWESACFLWPIGVD